MDFLIDIDVDLFLFLNGLYSNWLDPLMLIISRKLTWIPLYTIILIWISKRYSWKVAGVVVLCAALLIALSDLSSVHLFKNMVKRLRPCHNEQLIELVHLVKGCGGKYGFVSSHASNTMALAMFLGFVIRSKWFFIGIIGWAVLVSYSRIYLGVHYPFDIVGGWILGIVIATIMLYIYKKLVKLVA